MKKYILIIVLGLSILSFGACNSKSTPSDLNPKRNRQPSQPQNIIRMNMPCWVYKDSAKCVKSE